MPKEFLTYQQQMEKLRSSGLSIEDEVDVFSAVIALRYLLRDDEFRAFKAKLVKCVNGYLSSDESIGEEHLLEAMGFPAEWKKITRYKIWVRPA